MQNSPESQLLAEPWNRVEDCNFANPNLELVICALDYFRLILNIPLYALYVVSEPMVIVVPCRQLCQSVCSGVKSDRMTLTHALYFVSGFVDNDWALHSKANISGLLQHHRCRQRPSGATPRIIVEAVHGRSRAMIVGKQESCRKSKNIRRISLQLRPLTIVNGRRTPGH